MPYTADNVPEHVPKAKAEQWAAVWNKVFEECQANNGKKEACEEKAFTAANAILKKEKEEMAELSYEQRRNLLGDKLVERYGREKGYWVRETYPDYLIAEGDGKLWKIPCTINEQGEASLGEAEAVAQEYVPLSELDGQWLEVFKAGNYGEKGDWPAEKLRQIAATYNPALHEAPVVIGHPSDDSPAWGWVKALRVHENGVAVLEAQPQQVSPEFTQLLQDGRFKKLSVALYTNFPATGGPYLRHLGFLGAQPPQVKGLRPIKFSGPADGWLEVEVDMVTLEDMKKAFLETLEKVGIKKPDSATPTAEQFAELQKQKAQLEQQLEATKQAGERVTALEKEKREAEVQQFIEGQRGKGKWPAAFDKLGLPALLAHLRAPEVKLTFGEGEDKKELTVYEIMHNFLESLPVIIPQGELVKAGKKTGGGTVKFTETPTVTLDETSVALRDRARQIAAERKISYAQALPIAREEMR